MFDFLADLFADFWPRPGQGPLCGFLSFIILIELTVLIVGITHRHAA